MDPEDLTDQVVSAAIAELRRAPTTESVSRAMAMHDACDPARDDAIDASLQPRVREALAQSVETNPELFFRHYGKIDPAFELAGPAYTMAETGSLSPETCEAIGDAFRKAPDFIRYPLLESLLGRVSRLGTSDALFAAARWWPHHEKFGGYDKDRLEYKQRCHDVWEQVFRHGVALRANEPAITKSAAIRALRGYGKRVQTLDRWRGGALHPLIEANLEPLLATLARLAERDAAQEFVALLIERVGAAAMDVRAARIDSEWREVAQKVQPEPVAPAADTPVHATLPVREFRRQGHFWTIRFDGVHSNLRDSFGYRYIHYLLLRPSQPVDALEIRASRNLPPGRPRAFDARPSEGASDGEVATHTLTDKVIDGRTKRDCEERLERIESELQEARAAGQRKLVADLETEKEDIDWYLRSSTGKGGEPREFKDERERARQSVSIAIKRARREIGQENQSLAAHLDRPNLKCGKWFVYSEGEEPHPPWEL